MRLEVGHLAEHFHFPLTVNGMKAQEDSQTITVCGGNVVPVQRWTELRRAASCSKEIASLCRSKYISPGCVRHQRVPDTSLLVGFFAFFLVCPLTVEATENELSFSSKKWILSGLAVTSR